LASEDLTAKVSRLIDLVDYQEDVVISGTIIDKKTGTKHKVGKIYWGERNLRYSCSP